MSSLQSSGSERAKTIYHGVELLGFTSLKGYKFTLKGQYILYRIIEHLLIKEEYKALRNLENQLGLSNTFSNTAISTMIRNSNNGLAKKLIIEFKDRGYGDIWLENKSSN